jgi:outer membrane protein assembly factor BamB
MEAAASATNERSRTPPRRVWITCSSLLAAIVLVRTGQLELVVGHVVDQAVRNIITLILGFSAAVSLLIWFLRESGHASRLKRGVVLGVAAAVLLAIAMLRIERVSGDLVPEFAFRWSASRDALLPPLAGDATGAGRKEPWVATTADFPRFLGPAGDGSLPGPAFETDWEATPPRRLWRRPIGAGWSGFVTCGDHAVTLEQRGEEELLSCYAVDTGEPEWVVAVPGRHQTVLGGIGPRSTPTIRDGRVYATGATGWLHVVDGASGQVLWKKDVLADLGIDPAGHAAAVAWGRAGSPCVTDRLVIVPGGGPRAAGKEASRCVALVAYDRSDGHRVWTAGEEQISYVSPTLVSLGGRDCILTVNEAHGAAYDPATGRELCSFAWPGHSNSDASCSQPHLLAGGRLFLSKGYGVGAAVFEISHPAETDADSLWQVREVWRQPSLLKTKFTNVVISGGHAYGLSDGILECVRIEDGMRAWKGGRYGQGQVLAVGEILLVQAESGEVVAVLLTPEGHRPLGSLPAIDGQTWNNLCVSGHRLLVRNAEEAACYELPLRAELTVAARVTAPVNEEP